MRSAGAQYRARRRRFFERHAAHNASAVRWAEANDKLPDGNSVEVMRQIDRLPKNVRDLIYEYGLIAVANYYNEGIRGRELAAVLKAHRLVMQNKWLQADM